MDEVFGLPAHPLLVHLPVVLLPLVALGAIAVAARPAWRDRFAAALAVVALIAAVGVFLAEESGEHLEERVEETASDGEEEAVEEHADQAEPMVALAGITMLVLVASALTSRRARRDGAPAGHGRVALGVALLAAVLSTMSAVQVARVGHSGADAVWSDVDERAGVRDEDHSGSG